MKTASVRQLRNDYAEVLRWVAAGQEVAITRRGVTVARLVPERPRERMPVDWSKSAAWALDRGSQRFISDEQMKDILRERDISWEDWAGK